MRELQCLRCGKDMQFGMREQFQLGRTSILLGDIPNIRAGALELDVYYCPDCGKVELFTPEELGRYSDPTLPQKKCPNCGSEHDFDFPKCPECGFDYYK